MVSLTQDQLSAGLAALSTQDSLPPGSHELVCIQLRCTADVYSETALLPSSLTPEAQAHVLVRGTRSALSILARHMFLEAPQEYMDSLQAARWAVLADARVAHVAAQVIQLVPLAKPAATVEVMLSMADGTTATASRRALRALTCLAWAPVFLTSHHKEAAARQEQEAGKPAHPLVLALGPARVAALCAHVTRLYGAALRCASESEDPVEFLGVAWDALDAAATLVRPEAGELNPSTLDALGEVREIAHTVQHALADPLGGDSQGFLERKFGLLARAVGLTSRPAGLCPSNVVSLPASPPASPPLFPILAERNNVFNDTDLLRARRVQRDVGLDELDAEAKAAIVARGLAASEDEEEEGATLGLNPFGAATRVPGEVGYGSSDSEGEFEAENQEQEAVVPSHADEVDEEEPTGIWRRQRVVKGSDPRGANEWRTRAEQWEQSSDDEQDLAGPRAPVAAAQRGESSGPPAQAGIQIGDERILLAAYAAPGGDTALSKGGRTSKARTQLKQALGHRWDDHQIESWATMLGRNPKREALLAPYQKPGLPIGGNPNLQLPRPNSSANHKGKDKDKAKDPEQGSSGKRPATARERRNKERRGNVARQRGADRKAARAGVFPE